MFVNVYFGTAGYVVNRGICNFFVKKGKINQNLDIKNTHIVFVLVQSMMFNFLFLRSTWNFKI